MVVEMIVEATMPSQEQAIGIVNPRKKSPHLGYSTEEALSRA